jgi:hypothetical protein
MTMAMMRFLPPEAVALDVLMDYTERWEHFWHSPNVQRVLPLPMQILHRKRKQELEENKNWYRPLDPVPSDEEAKKVLRLRQMKKRRKKQIQLKI